MFALCLFIAASFGAAFGVFIMCLLYISRGE